MTFQQKYAALKTYYEQKGHSSLDAARFANNALLLIGLDIPGISHENVLAASASNPPHWSDDGQFFFAE